MTTTTESVRARTSPYFGLDYYEERYGAWFFGREREGGTIITNLRAARLTLLHAESGAGKSSLLRAAVAWRLRKLADDSLGRRGTARSVPVVFSSWKDDPAAGLADAIHAAIGPYLAGRPAPGPTGGHLDEFIAAAAEAANASLLIMLDQFEEYFLYRSREPTPERFADELARCINRTDLRANFLVAIREDAYAGLGDLFKGRIANVYSNYLHIEHLDRASAEQAIRAPLDVYNRQADIAVPVTIQDELVVAVLDQVRAFDSAGGPWDQAATADGGGHVATPLLQLVMETIWQKERQEGSRQLRLSTLQNLHGVRRIVDDHLGQALSALSQVERRTAIDVFDHLVTPSGGKIAESIPDLANRTGHSENEVGTVLGKLDHERIVRPVPAAPGQDPVRFRRYEIFHDVLTPSINRAITARDEVRRARRLRRFAALAVTLLILMAAVAVVFAELSNTVNAERMTAESRQLAAEASLSTVSDPELGTLLALKALGLRDTSQAEQALRAALPGVQALRTFDDGSAALSAEFDPADGSKVLSADLSGAEWVSDVRAGQRPVRLPLGAAALTGSVSAAGFNPAGTELAIGYANGTVALFNARTGQKLITTSDGQAAINRVAFLGNTGEIAIASQQNLALWPYRKGPACCDILANAVAYTIGTDPADPHEFAVTTDHGPVIWKMSGSGPPRSRPLARTVAVNDVEFSHDGSEVVTAGNDGTVDVYDLATGDLAASFSASGPGALTAAFSPDGKHVVAGYLSGMVRVWDVSTRLPLTLLVGNAGRVNTAQFNADGSEVLTAGEDGTIRVWDALPRELRMEFPASSSDGTPNAVAKADYIGNRILTLDEEGNVEVFTAADQRQAAISPNLPVVAVAGNRAGTKIVTASQDGTVKLWQASGSGYSQVALPTSIDLRAAINDVGMSADGSRFAIASGSGSTVQVRSADTGTLLQMLNTDYWIKVVAVSPNGREIIGGDDDGHVEVWNNGTVSPQLVGTPGAAISNVSFSRDGSKYLTVSAGGVVDVRDAISSRLLTSIEACPSASTASFSPDGSKIVVACGDGTVRVFDAVTAEALITMQATNAGVASDAAFSPDGQSIVASIDAGTTGYVQVWNAELATSSLAQLEQLAEQRVTGKLTAAQQEEYLAGVSG